MASLGARRSLSGSDKSAWKRWLLRLLAVAGPGIVVTFADTEAGSITT
ncbi:MAG: hypothetical protein HKL91_09370, partial [Candidatus Eremiobacteraeota bacterium]|nr:hypothetical protein [Candidatus Eremiobacteraeota bacterium]